MKKIFIGVLALAMGLAGCNKGNDDIKSDVVSKGAKFVASVGMDRNLLAVDNGEMSGGGTTDDSKTINDNDLIGIQIFKKDNQAEAIASGVFTGLQVNKANVALANQSQGEAYEDSDLFKVELEHGVEYVVESTLIKNGEGVDLTNNYGIPFDNQENTIVSDWTTAPYVFDFTRVRNIDNNIMEHDRWYSKQFFKANYEAPEIKVHLRRISFMVNFYVYNVGVNTSVTGAVFTDIDGKSVLNFPANDNGVTKVTSDMCTTSKTINIGTKETPNNITVDVFAQEGRIFTMPDVSNAYSCVKEEGGDHPHPYYEMINDIDFDFGVGNGTDWTIPLRHLNASFRPMPNHCYNIYVDANTNMINVIGVSLDDEWETTPIEIHTTEKTIR
jgi:hypothetical protein